MSERSAEYWEGFWAVFRRAAAFRRAGIPIQPMLVVCQRCKLNTLTPGADRDGRCPFCRG